MNPEPNRSAAIAQEIMASPVHTVPSETTLGEAQQIMLRYGHAGLTVVDSSDRPIGILSNRDLEIALHHGLSQAPVKAHLQTRFQTIAPHTPVAEIAALMTTYSLDRLPVLTEGELVGIVTRTAVLRQLQPVLPQNLAQAKLSDRLVPALWELLQAIAQLADANGWQLYLVGGAVRDLLLAKPDQPLLTPDLDLVVDGFHRSADQAAGVELAKALQVQYPQVRLQIHPKFQTAALLWQNDRRLGTLAIDIATARTEFYPYPAANPEVEASSIRQDLYRRDFTINALAIRLTQPHAGELLDFFGGILDLEAQQIRVLHANSFIEDPTRIFRAVRFAVRLGFQLEPQTEGYIHSAIASGIYDRAHLPAKVPALQTRLRQELKYTLQAPYWQQAMPLLGNLNALACIHPDLHLSDRLWWQLRLADRALKRFDPQETILRWQMLLEVLLTALPPADRLLTAQALQLPADSCDRLARLATIQMQLEQALPKCSRPSEIVQQLSLFDRSTLILLVATLDRHLEHPMRRQIWRYLTDWSTLKSPLSGKALKAMGYQPGEQFRAILEALRLAMLDGVVGDRLEAESYVRANFPISEP